VMSEFNTSKMHHRCGEELSKNMVTKEIRGKMRRVEEGRFRFCATCGTEEKPEEVQRDDNAMLNIMEAGICLIRGRPRPAYLTR
jgi:transposase